MYTSISIAIYCLYPYNNIQFMNANMNVMCMIQQPNDAQYLSEGDAEKIN